MNIPLDVLNLQREVADLKARCGAQKQMLYVAEKLLIERDATIASLRADVTRNASLLRGIQGLPIIEPRVSVPPIG